MAEEDGDQYQRFMSLPPMFPQRYSNVLRKYFQFNLSRARRRVSSLLELTLKSTTILVARFIASPHSGNLKWVAKMRRFVRKMLPASLITAILRGLIPGQVFIFHPRRIKF